MTDYPINTPFNHTFTIKCRPPFKIQPDIRGAVFDYDWFSQPDKIIHATVINTGEDESRGETYATINVSFDGSDDGWLDNELELFYKFEDVCYQRQRLKITDVLLDDYDGTPQCAHADDCLRLAHNEVS